MPHVLQHVSPSFVPVGRAYVYLHTGVEVERDNKCAKLGSLRTSHQQQQHPYCHGTHQYIHCRYKLQCHLAGW